MAKNRAIYGWDKPKAPPKPKKEMPFKASRRHEYWSIDVRYIEHHQLPNIKGPVYVISILENFSRMQLASAISEKQDTAAYLRVLAKALRNWPSSSNGTKNNAKEFALGGGLCLSTRVIVAP